MTDHDPINHPRHYNSHPSGIETIRITRELPFDLGNAVKYVMRAEHKNGLEDLKKARWYLNDFLNQPARPKGWDKSTTAATLCFCVADYETHSSRRKFFNFMGVHSIERAAKAVQDMIDELEQGDTDGQ